MIEKYKEYREKWDSMPKEFVQEKVPVHLDLEITTKCNLKCIMCARNVEHTKPMDMNFKMAKNIIDEFTEKGGVSIKFCYLGEPTLYPHLVELVKYSKEKGIVDTRIATNGNTLTEEQSLGLIKAGLDNIIFSVDSIYPDTYKSIRVGGNLMKVIQNIKAFGYIRNTLREKKPIIQVQAIPFPENRIELDSGLYDAFYKSMADKVWVGPWCKNWDKYVSPNMTQSEFFCAAPFRRILIRVDGQIWLCCGDPLKEKYIGQFPEMSIEEAWNSIYLKKVRRDLNNGNVHLIEACKKCSERYFKQ